MKSIYFFTFFCGGINETTPSTDDDVEDDNDLEYVNIVCKLLDCVECVCVFH